MKFKIKKNSNKYLFWMLVFIAFLKPAFLGTISSISILIDIIRIAVVLILGARYFLIKKKISFFVLYILLYGLVPVCSTLLYGGNVFNAFTFWAVEFGVVMLIFTTVGRDRRILFNSLYPALEILIFSNFITIILYPNGLFLFERESGWISNQVWILGLRNAQTTYLVLGIIVSTLYYALEANGFVKKIRVGLMYVVVLLSVSTLDIGSGYLACGVFVLLIFIFNIYKKLVLSFKVCVWGHIFIFLFLTLLGKLEIISSMVTSLGLIVGRTGTALARLSIWSTSWDKVLESPLIGHGMLDIAQLNWLTSIAAGATTTHNTFLDMWFRGGLLCFVFYILILIKIDKKLNTIKNDNLVLYNVASISIFSFFIVAQSEGAMTGATMYFLLGILWVIPEMVWSKQYE